MDQIRDRIVEEFGNKLRIRVCGICFEEDRILLVNHQSLNENGDFWAPPGGGMDFGQSAEENLLREFVEETGLVVEIDRFGFVHEYLSPPLHAIELFFIVRPIGGALKLGSDPEMGHDEQILKSIDYISFRDIKKMKTGSYHQLFNYAEDHKDLLEMNGFYPFKK